MLDQYADLTRARQLLTESRDLAEQLGDSATVATAGSNAAWLAFLEGRGADAIGELERNLALVERMGDPRGVAWYLMTLAAALLTDRARGRQKAEYALALANAKEDDADLALPTGCHYTLGLYWRWSKQPDRALDHFLQVIDLQRQLFMAPTLAMTLLHVARLVAARDPLKAAEIGGAGQAIADRVGVQFDTRLLRAALQLREDTEQRLGVRAAQHAWAAGRQLSTYEAAALALTGRRAPHTVAGGLSTREWEVSELVVRGLTSRQIARVLHLSARTVDNHLARIYGKLGVGSRVQLAGWVQRVSGLESTGTVSNRTLSS